MAEGTNASATCFAAGVMGAGVNMARPVLFVGRSTFTRASMRNVVAAARPRPRANQFNRNRRCFGRTPAVATPRPAASAARPISTRALSSGETPRGRSFFSSASSSEKSFMGNKVFLERAKRIAVARSRRVLGNSEGRRDLGEGEFVPDLHHQHLTLFHWQTIDSGSQLALRTIIEIKLRLRDLLHVGRSSGLTASAAGIFSEKIERDGADGGVKQSLVADAMLFAPE